MINLTWLNAIQEMFNLRKCCTATMHNGHVWISLLLVRGGEAGWSVVPIELLSAFYMDYMKLVSHGFSQCQCLAVATSRITTKQSMT